MGRPTKRTPALEMGLLDNLLNGASRAEALREAGIHRATFQRWLAADRRFAATVRDAEDGPQQEIAPDPLRHVLCAGDRE